MDVRDIPSGTLNWLGEINPFTQPLEDHAYTQLAHAARRGSGELLAGLLLPGDVIAMEGFALEIESVIPIGSMIGFHFVDLDFALCVPRDTPIRVVHKITPPKLTLDDVLDPR